MACTKLGLGCLALTLAITLGSGCERKPRAREREAAAERAQAEARAKEAARRASLPPPEEPPVELLRVPDSGFSCRLDDVFAAKCRRCHTIPARHGAPLVFLTWDDAQQDRNGQKLTQVIGRAVRSGFMPYRIEANPPVQQLTDEEKQVILDWVDAGGPKQTCETALPSPQKSGAGATPIAPSASTAPRAARVPRAPGSANPPH